MMPAKRFIIVLMLAALPLCFGMSRTGETAALKPSVPMVTFVFDDGFDTDALVAKDIFIRQGAVACSAVVTDWINRPGFLTANQIIGLRDAGWEILSHTASHPNLRSLPPDRVAQEFARSKEALEQLGLNVKNLVYPYNKSNDLIREIARKYYRSGRGGENELNDKDIDQYNLHSVSNRRLDLEKIERDINLAYAERSWLIIHQHKLDSKITLTDKNGSFTKGEDLIFSPSGARGRHIRDEWFLTAGYLHMVVLSGKPRPGDKVLGKESGTTALLNKVVYDEGTEVEELLSYIRAKYPAMKIVTIDKALDILGEPDIH